MRTLPALLVWAITCPLLGQARHPKDESTSTARSAVPRDSAQNREGKDWETIMGLGHLHPFFGLRVRFSRFLDPDSFAFIDASGGIAADSNPFHDLSNTTAEGRKFAAGYKQFLSKSLYFEGSAFHRSVARMIMENPKEYKFSSMALGVELLIGNQWQWNRFTLGCDWVGVHVPISLYGERYKGYDGTERFGKKSKDFKKFSQKAQPIVAGFYLGFSF